MIIPVIVIAVVFILIAIRQLENAKLRIWQLIFLKIPVKKSFQIQIWHIMLFGSLAVLLTGQIQPMDAARSINPDVMLFLFGMFVVGHALEESGYISHISYRLFRRSKNSDHLLLLIIFGIGFASAFLMNDTLAIIGTPVMLMLARRHSVPAKPLLLALAFAITIGGVMSPIGNPQNLLIAMNSNVANPFLTFFRYLLVPTIINLFAAFVLLKFFFRNHLQKKQITHSEAEVKPSTLYDLSRLSISILIFLVFMKIAGVFFGIDFSLTYIALAAAAPIIIFYPKRLTILRNIDWRTLVFFASMFILMQSVWQTGFFQSLVTGYSITSMPVILGLSAVVSQFISNVPLVALFMPLITHAGAGTLELMALSAGSTIAGNLFLLGAASNVIIIQNAEKKGETITFWEFARIGIPLTIVNLFVYWFFLSMF